MFSHVENKVSELSTTIGEYEAQKYEDQQLIKKLRHKLENIDTEKSVPLASPADENKEDRNEKINEKKTLSPLSPVSRFSYSSESGINTFYCACG